MAERTKEEIIEQIKHIIETNVKPAVASHGGVIDFVDYNEKVDWIITNPPWSKMQLFLELEKLEIYQKF